MRIEDILKENQPQEYKILNKKIREKSKHQKRDKLSQELTEKDIKELMGHSSYRRGSNGAIRQVR